MITLLATLSLTISPAISVELPMEAYVIGTEIELGEIADIVGANPDEVRLIESIELGYAPAPGYSRLLRADRIKNLLARKVPTLKIEMRGQRATRVWPQVVEIPDADVHTVALTELRRTYSKKDATFELASALPKIVVPAGAKSHDLRARVDETRLVSGHISIPVEILVDGAVYRTVWTNWKTEVYETVPVLTQRVRAGETLAPEMFARQRVRLTAGAKAKPLPLERILGAVAARDLAPGEVVTGIDVHRPALVALGDSIFLCVKKGGIEARVPAIAKSAGAAGDRIRVQTIDTRQELTAVVRTRDLAEIVLGD